MFYWCPRKISPAVLSMLILLQGSSSCCNLIYLPVCRRQTPLCPITVQSKSCLGPFMLDSPAPGFDGGNSFSKKIAEATRWTIIHLDISLKGIDSWAEWTRSFTFQLNCSISGACSFLDAQFRDLPFPHVYIKNRHQHVCTFFWSHAVVISCETV